MYANPLLVSIFLLISTLPASADLDKISLDELEQRLSEVDEQLSQLPPFNLRGGVGSIGYRSLPSKTRTTKQWVEVDLGRETPIDEIALVPCLWRSTESGTQADGFPLEFRIIAGKKNEQEGELIASYTEEDGLLPRIAPVVVPCSGTIASWVRVEADILSPRGHDGRYILHLAELMVFKGSKTSP